MDKLFVNLGENSYDIIFDTSYSALCDALKNIDAPKKLLIVTDSNVAKIWLKKVQNLLDDAGYDTAQCIISAGEKHKGMAAVLQICGACCEHKMDRKSMIVALGGGVVGDITGFAASMYMRGIRFVQLPTTLLSQSDSSVGGKTGIDFKNVKNILGAFHQPSLVYINSETLKTLPKKEFKSGMGEVIKHGIIKDAKFFDFLLENAEKIKSLDDDVLIKMAKTNCSIKADVVMSDEKEQGLRAILNFGHTIGHAIESAAEFSKTHGECVVMGMCAASHIALGRNLIDGELFEKIIDITKKYDFDIKIDISSDKIFEFMKNDKKSVDSKIKFVLPVALGSVLMTCDVTDDEVSDALEFLRL